MKRFVVILAAVAAWLVPEAAQAQSMKKIQQQLNELQKKLGDLNTGLECQNKRGDEKIETCSRLIKKGTHEKGTLALLYDERGLAYLEKGDVSRGMGDLDEAVRVNGREAGPYVYRGVGKSYVGQYSDAVSELNKAEERNAKPSAWIKVLRGEAYLYKGDLDAASEDFNGALQIEPNAHEAARAHCGLADVLRKKRRLPDALAEYEQALRHATDQDLTMAGKIHLGRGAVYLDQGDYDRALTDYTRVISSGVGVAGGHMGRGEAYETMGQNENALAEYRKAIEKAAAFALDQERIVEARRRIAALEAQPAVVAIAPQAAAGQRVAPAQAPRPTVAPDAGTNAGSGRKVALVIGMSAYAHVPALVNPRNDARAIAQTLRRLGFADVTERHDLDMVGFSMALKEFSDKAANSDWAVIYFAGHGVEAGGVNYLVPVDAKLASQNHVEFETLALNRVLSVTEPAKKLRLVILDACRNNPFQMAASAGRTRSVGRGLGRVEPSGGVMVAYAARDGAVAEDGAAAHSPFTQALLEHLPQTGLEIGLMFRKVRGSVLAATGGKQEPFTYGALPEDGLYFAEQ